MAIEPTMAMTCDCGSMVVNDLGGGQVRFAPATGFEDADAHVLDPDEVERLVSWLSMRVPVVREYFNRLKRERDVALAAYDRLKLEWHVPEDAAKLLAGPTLGERLYQACAPHRTRKPGPHDGSCTWLARQVGVQPMVALRYLKDKAVPVPHIAERIADVLGWSHDEMHTLCHAARVRKALREVG